MIRRLSQSVPGPPEQGKGLSFLNVSVATTKTGARPSSKRNEIQLLFAGKLDRSRAFVGLSPGLQRFSAKKSRVCKAS